MAVLLAFNANAKLTVPTWDDLPDLKPEGVHQTACTRTANSFIRAHYKPIDIDNEFADKVIDRFLAYLDYNRSLFTQAEVDEIYANRSRIIRAVQLCDLSYPYDVYNIALRKRFTKYSFFVDQIKNNKIDLTVNESVELDRHESPYFKTEEELRHEWLLELKNDYINQLLSDKTDKEVKERLERRYNAALSKLGQTRSEDVFSIFENSFATAIDPHTSYLSPDDSENFNDNLNLSLEGIGAVLTSEDEYTVINSILPGSPAEKSKKLKAKDRIVGVRQQDGTYDDILGWRLNEVVKRIKGPKGSKVILDIERGEGSQMTTFSVELTREKVRLQDSEAKAEIKEYNGKKIAVLKIKSFYTNLHKDIEREIKKAHEETNGKLDALIIDLRNNGGGLLPEATLSSGLFIKNGPIVLVRDARGNVMPQNDFDKSVAYEGPLVVLINRLSASSSEIMAAALRDYGRALVVGDTSFGKGTVQQSKPLSRVYDFSDEELGSIHYTIAKFYRINGGSTQLKGVEPDIYLPTLMDKEKIGESSEPNALPWDKINAITYDGYLNIDAYVQSLTKQSQDRIKDNVFFKVTASDLERYQELKAKKVISVNLEERRALKKEDDDYRLKTTNMRLEAMGEKPVAKIKDLPEDFEFDDAVLDETIAIASDFADAQREKIYSAKSTPVLQRYPAVQHDSLTEGHAVSSPAGAAVVPGPYMPVSAVTVEALPEGAAATLNTTDESFSGNSRVNEDGSFIGPWRTQNEDDTYLRFSDIDFVDKIKQERKVSNSMSLQDPVVFSPMLDQESSATNTIEQGKIRLELRVAE